MIAFDTNVLVYAVSSDEIERRDAAMKLFKQLPVQQTVLLWQVLAEFGAVLTRMDASRRADPRALEIANGLRSRYRLVLPSASVFDRALKMVRTDQLSYWDALLISGCIEADVKLLWTEDLQSRPEIEGVQIRNPFRDGIL